MKKVTYLLVLAAAMLQTTCHANVQEEAGIEFEAYRQNAKLTGNDKELRLLFDIPVGEGDKQANVKKGILEIISKTEVARVYGAPKGKTLKEVADNYVAAFKKRNNIRTQFPMELYIKNMWQNEACVVFYVVDSGKDFLTSSQHEVVVRLSDGHVMTRNELARISRKDILALARKYADATQRAKIAIEGNYSFSFGPQGFLFHPNQYGILEYAIPVKAITPYLTAEAKRLLAAKPILEYPQLGRYEPGKGDLPRYGLRGPVKSVETIGSEQREICTFDVNGRLTSEKTVFNDGTSYDDNEYTVRTQEKRDNMGRLVQSVFGDATTTYSYDEAGRFAKLVHRWEQKDQRVELYYYDGPGMNYKLNEQLLLRDHDYAPVTTKYSGYKYDAHGNWTERYTTESLNGPVTRVITYYE